MPSYQTPLAFKTKILNKRRNDEVHACFKYFSVITNSETDLAKKAHSFHCASYDTSEEYLCYAIDDTE